MAGIETQGRELQPGPEPPARPSWLDKQLLRELPNEWRKAYLFFALAVMLVLLTASMINPPSISTFNDSIGKDKYPTAQIYLPVVLIPVLLVYNFLCTALKSPALLVATLSCAYSVVYFLLAIRSLSERNMEPWLAWIFFYACNTKSVLFPVMLWSVMNDVSTSQYSKVAYPALVLAQQMGGIMGSLWTANVSHVGGTTGLLFAQAFLLVLLAFLVWRACALAASAPVERDAEAASTSLQPVAGSSRPDAEPLMNASPSQPGACSQCGTGCKAVGLKMWELVEGIYLIATKPFVAGIFWVACAHLVPRTILDYQGVALIDERWPRTVDGVPIPGNKDKQTAFFAWCNLANTFGAALLSVLGLRKLIEKGGLALTLSACPLVMLISVLLVCFFHSFWTVQIVLVLVNVVQYALNGPSREMLYVQTSKEIKYKAKSWSDMYGNFLQKFIGAMINNNVNKEMSSCQPHCFNATFSGIFTVGWCTFWGIVAAVLGMKHAQLVRDGQKIS